MNKSGRSFNELFAQPAPINRRTRSRSPLQQSMNESKLGEINNNYSSTPRAGNYQGFKNPNSLAQSGVDPKANPV